MPRRGPSPVLARGMPRRTVVGRNPQVAAVCPEAGCGEPVDVTAALAHDAGRQTPRLPRGWIQIRVGESTLPEARYCSPSCAAVGIALAQLRLTPLLK